MKSLVLLSGGQDSSVCAALELQSGNDVECIFIDYGQQHIIEKLSAINFCKQLGLRLEVFNIQQYCEISNSGSFSVGSPVIINRNAILLTLASSYAISKGIARIVMGACLSDYEVFPDCRQDFLMQLRGLVFPNGEFATPLINLSKREVLKLGSDIGLGDWLNNGSHTCYRGSRLQNDWGVGCGNCPSCRVLIEARGA